MTGKTSPAATESYVLRTSTVSPGCAALIAACIVVYPQPEAQTLADAGRQPNVAVTVVVAGPIVTVQTPVPEQPPPLQPSNCEAAVAVNVT